MASLMILPYKRGRAPERTFEVKKNNKFKKGVKLIIYRYHDFDNF